MSGASILAQHPRPPHRRTSAATIRVGEQDLRQLPQSVAGRKLAYAGVDPILFPGSIRENLVYGLRYNPLGVIDKEDEREAVRRLSGGAAHRQSDREYRRQWIDYAMVGAKDEEDLDLILIDLMKKVGLEDGHLSLRAFRPHRSGTGPRVREPPGGGSRKRLRETFQAEGMADLVEPFDLRAIQRSVDARRKSSVWRTDLAIPIADAISRRTARFRSAIDQAGLFDDLVGMGRQIAETMTEIFGGLPPGHSLFEQFSFIGAEELPEFAAIIRRSRSDEALTREERARLLSLPLQYIEARHRLGLIDDDLKIQFVQARRLVRDELEKVEAGVEFYDPERVCAAAPVRDNLLFGRVSYRVANAQARVAEAISAAVRELGLLEDIERVGLDRQVGTAGRLLTAQERASVNLVRCLVKRPDILVIDGALAPFDEGRAQKMIKLLIELGRGKSLFMVLPNDRQAQDFDILMRFGDGKITTESNAGRDEATEPRSPNAQRMAGEVA